MKIVGVISLSFSLVNFIFPILSQTNWNTCYSQNLRCLTRLDSGNAYRPAWSDDMHAIVFDRIVFYPSEMQHKRILSQISVQNPFVSFVVFDTETWREHPTWAKGLFACQRYFSSTRDWDIEITTTGTQPSKAYLKLYLYTFDNEIHPALSPVERKLLAFSADYGGTQNIWLAKTDGGLEKLTNRNHAHSPAWSFDGQKIAFVSDFSGNNDIWIINKDGTGETQITSSPSQDTYPCWSFDGNWIFFVSERSGNKDIWLVDLDSRELKNVTDNSAEDRDPAVSPDGDSLAFSSNRLGEFDIWIMDISSTTEVTTNPISDFYGFRLYSAFPNPFNGTATIYYEIGKKTKVNLSI